MIIISTRDFRANQTKFLDMANNGEDIVLKSREKGSFKIVPVKEDDTLMSKEEFYSQIERAIADIREGRSHSMLPGESLDDFLNRMGDEVHV